LRREELVGGRCFEVDRLLTDHAPTGGKGAHPRREGKEIRNADMDNVDLFVGGECLGQRKCPVGVEIGRRLRRSFGSRGGDTYESAAGPLNRLGACSVDEPDSGYAGTDLGRHAVQAI
jgi:hypothetical protein